jgi:tight adherence protein C
MAVYLIIGFVFLGVFLFSFGVLYLLAQAKDPVRLRLRELEEQGGEEEAEGKRALSLKGAADLVGLSAGEARGTRIWLAQAGYRGHQSAFNYQGLRLFGAISLAVASLFLSLFLHADPALIPFAVFAGLLVGAFAPRFWVSYKISRRREEIRRSVPSVLDLMVVCVEAGLSLNAAVQRITEETRDTYIALSEELHLVNQEILIGKTRAEAFRNLARRTGVDELRSLAVMLIQADKLGTSVASSLRVLADSLRVKRRQRAEEAAHKTQVKLVFPLVLLIFPELMVILVGPAMISLYKALSDMAK